MWKSDSNHQVAALWFRKEVTGKACKELKSLVLAKPGFEFKSQSLNLDRDSFETEVKRSHFMGMAAKFEIGCVQREMWEEQ